LNLIKIQNNWNEAKLTQLRDVIIILLLYIFKP